MTGHAVLTSDRSSRPAIREAGAGAPHAVNSPAEQALTWVSWLIDYLLFGAVLLRALLVYGLKPQMGPIGLLLGLYLILHSSLAWGSRRAAWYPPVYLTLQVVLVTALLCLPDFQDFFAVLFAALSAQVVQYVTPRQAFGWMGLFAAVMLYLLLRNYGTVRGVTVAVVYSAISAFVALYTWTSERARAARSQNQALLHELEQANRQLAAYAAQLEQLAIARERSRLARELHDSVTQTIFSLTLSAQSALLLLDRDPARVAPQLYRLQELARCALGECAHWCRTCVRRPWPKKGCCLRCGGTSRPAICRTAWP